MNSHLWAALTKIWFFILWLICLVLESLVKLFKLMGGAESSEQGTRNVRPRTTHSEHRYQQEQHEGTEFSREWSHYGDYRAPFQTYDSDPTPYPAAPHASAPPQDYSPRGYAPQSSGYSRAQPMPPPGSSRATRPRPKLERKYSKIADNYSSLEEITDALAQAGLESSNLIVGIDFTKSNEWTGKLSFNGRSLHYISDTPNPYEQAISIIGQTLSAFDEDNLIPCFGFGDASTHDQDVFSFYLNEKPCNGFPEALSRYREIVPQLRLAGPTSFAPMIEMAMTIVGNSGGQYHVLLIIADGQVTRSVDTEFGQLSSQERRTVDAIVKASELPLSIILVGVGDGPWGMMQEFDDNIPARSFDNFQFVNFTAIMSKDVSQTRKETEFAVSALMEVPSQYKATLELGILGRRDTKSPERVPLPPPFGTFNVASTAPKTFASSSGLQQRAPSHSSDRASTSTSPPAATPSDSQVCPVCLSNSRDMAFGCGHQTCSNCEPSLESCPICRRPIETRIKLY
ncbi:E3 ubiquitin-protein ligase RGLG2-like isoform X2 [Ananas comosus]|uniref:E3 ubiquitin-protein ligase RGLG2-like isoform X2 n=1 Tax=Ananas comosus TaxID=4615 RepID=A0A6P5GM66_ANACO|nr:E3 ubiquitin-protein ligase RGLG2-like isoform X2 [Ananas comosus]